MDVITLNEQEAEQILQGYQQVTAENALVFNGPEIGNALVIFGATKLHGIKITPEQYAFCVGGLVGTEGVSQTYLLIEINFKNQPQNNVKLAFGLEKAEPILLMMPIIDTVILVENQLDIPLDELRKPSGETVEKVFQTIKAGGYVPIDFHLHIQEVGRGILELCEAVEKQRSEKRSRIVH